MDFLGQGIFFYEYLFFFFGTHYEQDYKDVGYNWLLSLWRPLLPRTGL